MGQGWVALLLTERSGVITVTVLAQRDTTSEFDTFVSEQSALLISHRLSTVRMADCIYVLDNQTIAEQGTHDDLMRRAGIYADLFSTQAACYQETPR